MTAKEDCAVVRFRYCLARRVCYGACWDQGRTILEMKRQLAAQFPR